MSKVNSTSKQCRRGGTKNSPSKTQKDFIEGEFTQYKTEIFYNDATRTFTMYLLGEITAPEDYVNVFNTFNQAVDGETIEVFIVSGGGRKDTMDAIRGAAERTEAFTKAIVGDVGSAATIIPLIFDELEALPNTEFFCHNYSGGAFGKHHELMSQVDFMKKEMPECFRRYYKHFLTDEEIEYVIAGNDIYLNAEEVNERWQRVLAFREAELDVIIEADKEAQKEYHLEALNKLGFNTKEEPPLLPKAPIKKKPKDTKELKDEKTLNNKGET